jgi:hypothetical protein
MGVIWLWQGPSLESLNFGTGIQGLTPRPDSHYGNLGFIKQVVKLLYILICCFSLLPLKRSWISATQFHLEFGSHYLKSHIYHRNVTLNLVSSTDIFLDCTIFNEKLFVLNLWFKFSSKVTLIKYSMWTAVNFRENFKYVILKEVTGTTFIYFIHECSSYYIDLMNKCNLIFIKYFPA